MLKELKVKVNVSKGSVLTGNAWVDVLFGGEKVVEHAEVTALFKPIDEVKTNTIEFTIEQFDDSFQNTLTIINSPETIGPIQIYAVEFYLDGENAGVNWQKATKEKYTDVLSNLNDVIIDGTGAASRPLLKKKEELEALGYETMMIMIYVSPITSLERNANRDRSLMPGIVLRTWRDINNNIEIYQQAFGDNLVIINNDPKDAETDFDENEIKRRFFDTSKAKGKPKTPEEQAKTKADVEKLNRDIKLHLKQKPKFTPASEAVAKVKEFIK